MLRICLLLLSAGLFSVAVLAQTTGPDRPLDDPAAERRAIALHKQLRCLVCQNQSIAESNADLARDLRQLVRERIAAGDSDDAVFAFLVARYGDWVLLKPPFNAATSFLWLGPVALLVLGAIGVVVWYRRLGARPLSVAPLSADEQARLETLIEEDDADEGRNT